MDSSKNLPFRVLLVESAGAGTPLPSGPVRDPGGSDCLLDRVESLSEALSRLEAQTYDAVLIDPDLPDSQGLSTLASVQEQAQATPLILITDPQRESFAREAAQHGVQDCLLRDEITERRLARTLHYTAARQQNLVKLKQFDNLKSEFVATASHEMRTPLTILQEYISLLHDGVPGPINAQQTECLSAARRNCDRLANLVSDLLDMSRIESGRLRLRRLRTEPSELIDALFQDFKTRCESKGQRLELDLPDDLPAVLADPFRIQQVLINLLGNAHKFSDANSRITVRGVGEADCVRFEVLDEGPGLDPSVQDVIFDAFTQVGRKDAPGYQGTGLGLAISRSIVDLHGGSIGVQSDPGQGSRFYFTLPQYKDGIELDAFVSDKLTISRNSKKPITLALLSVDTTAADESAHERWLIAAEETADNIFRQTRDESLLIPEKKMVALLFEGSEEGAWVAISRFAATLQVVLDEQPAFRLGVAELQAGHGVQDWIDLATSRVAPLTSQLAASRRRRVLIVDDEQPVLDLIVDILEASDLDLEIMTASCGYEACVRFGDFRPDLVVLDIQLPDIDGEKVLRTMQQSTSRRSNRFLVISGNSERIKKMVELGCADSLLKPFSAQRLVEVVGTLISPVAEEAAPAPVAP